MIWELLIQPANYIFSLSLILCFAIGTLEIILLLIGGSTQFFEHSLPEQQFDYLTDTNTDINPSLFGQFLDWLYLGKTPLLIWLIIFLTIYALVGFIVQSVSHYWIGYYFPTWIVAVAVLFIAMPLVRFSAKLIAQIIPRDETTAIFSQELIGRQAEILLGIAAMNSPAQAKVKDQFGQTHYVLVEPEQDEHFKQGQCVILTKKTKLGFQAILSR